MWDNEHVILDGVKAKTRATIIFKYIPEDSQEVKMEMYGDKYNVSASCGCSSLNWNPATLELEVTYVPNAVPQHLLAQGSKYYLTTKEINGVLIVNGEREVFKLQFTAKVVQ